MDYADPAAWRELTDRLTRRHPPELGPCGRVSCEPGWLWKPALTDHDLWLVLGGRGRVRLGADEHPLRPGTLLTYRPGDDVFATQDPRVRLTVVYCHVAFVDPAGGWPADVGDEWLPPRVLQLGDRHGPLGAQLQRIVELSRDRHPLSTLEIRARLLSAFAEIFRQDAYLRGHAVAGLDPRVRAVVDHVLADPGRRLSLTDAAALAGLSPHRFSRLFTSEQGVSLREFVVQTRLARARSLLSETTMTVGEIARALGYADVALFSRQFRRRYGSPPTRARHS